MLPHGIKSNYCRRRSQGCWIWNNPVHKMKRWLDILVLCTFRTKIHCTYVTFFVFFKYLLPLLMILIGCHYTSLLLIRLCQSPFHWIITEELKKKYLKKVMRKCLSKKAQKRKDLSNMENIVNKAFSLYKETDCEAQIEPARDRNTGVNLKLLCCAAELSVADSVDIGNYGLHFLTLIPKKWDHRVLIISVWGVSTEKHGNSLLVDLFTLIFAMVISAGGCADEPQRWWIRRLASECAASYPQMEVD